MTLPDSIVFLVDVDNTLLDNDKVAVDVKRFLDREVGRESQERYFAILEDIREQIGYSDYLASLQRYRLEYPHHAEIDTLASFLVDYPFANRLHPGSLDVLERLRGWGPVVLFSDGDVVFQPRKIERAGLRDARGRRADLRAQGARAGGRRAALPRRALRARGRQAAHARRRQDAVGSARDHRLSAPGPVCP